MKFISRYIDNRIKKVLIELMSDVNNKFMFRQVQQDIELPKHLYNFEKFKNYNFLDSLYCKLEYLPDRINYPDLIVKKYSPHFKTYQELYAFVEQLETDMFISPYIAFILMNTNIQKEGRLKDTIIINLFNTTGAISKEDTLHNLTKVHEFLKTSYPEFLI
jgi:hypothetical protein